MELMEVGDFGPEDVGIWAKTLYAGRLIVFTTLISRYCIEQEDVDW